MLCVYLLSSKCTCLFFSDHFTFTSCMCYKLYWLWSQFGMAIIILLFLVSYILSSRIEWKCTLQKQEVSSRLGWWHGFSVFQSVNIATSHQMSSTWEDNWICALELKKQENCNGLKGRSRTMTLPQVSMVFFPSDNQTIYTFIQMTRMSSSCSLYI